MRISDWSSDVCSSDLGRAPSTSARHPLRVCAGRGQAATLLPLNPSGWPMPHHTSLIAMLVYGFVLAFIFGALANRLRLSPLVRSEEHTSELQSLMRISYAVFCLTKKKTKH